MSKYVRYYSERQSAYRTLATMYANWIDTAKPSTEEVQGISKFFQAVAKRFGLITEFKELGIMQ